MNTPTVMPKRRPQQPQPRFQTAQINRSIAEAWRDHDADLLKR